MLMFQLQSGGGVFSFAFCIAPLFVLVPEALFKNVLFPLKGLIFKRARCYNEHLKVSAQMISFYLKITVNCVAISDYYRALLFFNAL